VDDANGDGRLDVLVLGTRTTAFERFIATETGFSRSTGITPAFTACVPRDVTGDGRLDLVAAVPDRAEIVVLEGLPTGSYRVAGGAAPPGIPGALALVDCDDDSRLDLLTTHSNAPRIAIARGYPGNTFGVRRDIAVAGTALLGLADVNDDGWQDLLTSSGSDLVTLVNQAGALTPQHSALGAAPVGVLVRDLDGDRTADVAVSLDNAQVTIATGDGSGVFVPAQQIPVGQDPAGVAVLEMTGDRQPDVAVACRGSDDVAILAAIGGGQFVNASRPSVLAGELPAGVAIGTLNADTKLDLAVANEGSNTVSILLGQGSGAFRSVRELRAGGGPRAVAIAELNEDRHLDLAIGNWAANSVQLRFGDSQAAFTEERTLPLPARPVAIMAVDLNGDRRNDLVVICDGGVVVFLQAARGFFQSPVHYPVANVTAGTAHDANGDGWPDIAIAREARSVRAGRDRPASHRGRRTGPRCQGGPPCRERQRAALGRGVRAWR
jgi:hypothetical protein